MNVIQLKERVIPTGDHWGDLFFSVGLLESLINNPALVPCKGSDCPEWKKWEGRGGCHHLIKAGKHVMI